VTSSSTSSFELGPYERVRPAKVPVAALAFVVCLVAIELVVRAHQDWFADLAAWQWESKHALIAGGALDGDIAIFGTSVLFHGLDPTPANSALRTGTVVNLALNGMALQHQAQLLRRRLAASHPPSVAVVEFRRVTVDRNSWETGPYFRAWASFPDFLESRFYYWNPPVGLTFWANRLLVTSRYREAIDNWIFDIIRERGIPRHTRDRNRLTADAIRMHAGMAPATFDERQLQPDTGPARDRAWLANEAGEFWLDQLLTAAGTGGMDVVLLLPPAPPYLTEASGPTGFRALFGAEVERLRQKYPALRLEVFEPSGFVLSDFADELHLNAIGRAKLSEKFAQWLPDYRSRHQTRVVARSQ
jgi:hypothetical protein